MGGSSTHGYSPSARSQSRPGLQHLMVDVNNVQAMITIIRELAYSRLKEELSHVGFVSMTLDQAAQFYAMRDQRCGDVQGFRWERGEDHHLRDRQRSRQRRLFVVDQKCARSGDDV